MKQRVEDYMLLKSRSVLLTIQEFNQFLICIFSKYRKCSPFIAQSASNREIFNFGQLYCI